MQISFYHPKSTSLHLRVVAWMMLVKNDHFLAGRREGQGTALLPLFFSYTVSCLTRLGLLPNFASASITPASFSHATGEQSEIILMAGWDGEQGTAPLPPYHLPVLPLEVAQWMNAQPGECIIDGTLGGGGHSEIFLEAKATVLGIDRDPQAIAHASKRLQRFGLAFQPWQANYSQMADHPGLSDGRKADGILLDIGVSSHQLDSAARGFSFQKDGPLDMRMGPNAPRTAAELVNEESETEIIRILREFGEEPQARRIAQLIVQRRAVKPFTRTGDLAGTIEQAIGRHSKTHPATRTFQAIRMAVNEELALLSKALDACIACLKPGGRLLVISFHSLEDRLIKQFMQHRARATIDDPTWPAPRDNPEYYFTLPVRKSISAGKTELSQNTRARSAKLRVAVRNNRTTI